MKHEKITSFLISFLMASLLSFGALGAMVSGLNLPVESMDTLYQLWILFALGGTVLFLFKGGWIAALVIAVGGMLWLWPEYSFTLPARALITRLSSIYDSAYGWGVWEFAGVENWRTLSLDMPLCAWGCLIALAAAGTVMQNRWLVLTLVLALLPVASTIVVTNTPPDAVYVFIVMFAIVLLVLTATVRRQNPGQGALLTILTALPVGLLMGGLFAACPQETYVNRSEEYLDSVVTWWQNAFTFSFDNTGLVDQTPATPNASATSNLSRVGPRNLWGYTVMEAEADYTDVVYLRGQDFDVYDGLTWASTLDREENYGGTPDFGTWIYDGEITVRTSTPANVLYLPYYPTQEQTLSGGRMENEDSLREYTFGVRHPQTLGLPIYYSTLFSAPAEYTHLPSDTRRWAVEYLNEHFTTDFLQHSTDAAIAHDIAQHVRELVPYDTNTPRMSGDYDDFAQWFLEEAETGYCVHFATATAVLLRAAGVPARYVTGYMFESAEGETVEVTADQAHAWVEYYNEIFGVWMVLEPTPPDLGSRDEDPTDPIPEQTDPPTEKPTEETEAGETRPDDLRPGEPEAPKADLTWLWTALKWLLGIALAVLAVVGQYRIRRSVRRKGGNPNARALMLWQDVENLCRFTRQTPPETLEQLAQKAKFSQHTLTAEELQTFTAWLDGERNKLNQQPWYLRLVYQYVLALW